MTDLTLSATARAIQNTLNELNDELHEALTLAQHIGLPPFHIAHIQAALSDNQHAWTELGRLASSLELTSTRSTMPPCNLSTPHEA